MVESQPSKLLVAGSIPVSRSRLGFRIELVAVAEGWMGTMFEQAAIAVQDQQGYAKLHALIDAAFDRRDVEVLLNRVTGAKLRIRDFEGAERADCWARKRSGLYKALPVSDQGLTRERYLRLVEQVPQELRQRYFKAYAYY